MLGELKSLEIKKPFNWVSEIFEKLFAESSKDAIIYMNESTGTERKISYREFYENYNRFINFLRQMDIKKGSNIYIMAGAVPVINKATSAAGATCDCAWNTSCQNPTS